MTESTQQLLARVPEIKRWHESMRESGNSYNSDIPALCQAVQELAERNRWLTAQLQRIGINKDGIYCDCNHDDENCCERIGEFCPTCIAAVALLPSPPQEKP